MGGRAYNFGRRGGGVGGRHSPLIRLKNGNGIFGISASKGFRNVIICHAFRENNFVHFQCLKNFRRLWRQSTE